MTRYRQDRGRSQAALPRPRRGKDPDGLDPGPARHGSARLAESSRGVVPAFPRETANPRTMPEGC